MADQQLVGIDRIVNALKEVKTTIQKTQTYLDANTFLDSRRFGEGFGGASIVNSTGTSALLALLGITTLIPGAAGATGGTTGVLSIATKFRGASVSGSNVPIVDFDSQPGLGSSSVEITAGSNVADADFNSQSGLAGSSAGGSGAIGWMVPGLDGRGSIVLNSSASGVLDSQPGLGSSVVEITGASGSIGGIGVEISMRGASAGGSGTAGILSVETKVRGASAGGSGAAGILSVETKARGTSAGGSGAAGNLDVETLIQGSAAGGSGVIGSSETFIKYFP